MAKVLVTRNIPQQAIERVRGACEVKQWENDAPIPRDVLLEWVRGVDGVYCLLTERIDDALLDAASTAEPARQTTLYRHAQRRIHAELPYVPLWYEDNVAAVRAGVRGYALRPDGAWDALDRTDPPDARHPH